MDLQSLVFESMPAAKPSGGAKEMGKNDFLNLMMTQMQNQDPMNPMNNEAMLSQLAQFSSLEQMSNLNSSFESMASSGGFLDATRLLGKEVELLDKSTGSTIKSKVDSVSMSDTGPIVLLENGVTTTVDSIFRVSEVTNES